MIQKLEVFHHRCARYIRGQHIQVHPDGTWMYPPSTQFLEIAGIFSVQKHILCRKNTMKYILTRPIYQQCIASKPLARNTNISVWWFSATKQID
jgi:hypothetical protein